jgi:hypothetical protein
MIYARLSGVGFSHYRRILLHYIEQHPQGDGFFAASL